MTKDNNNVQNPIIAFVGGGVNPQNETLHRAPIQSIRVRVKANRHASIDNYCTTFSSFDTDLAATFHQLHPQHKILASILEKILFLICRLCFR